MVVGVCTVEIHLPFSHSLKEKRKVIKSLKDRLRRHNVSVAEVDDQDLWQRSVLAIAVVGIVKTQLESLFQAILGEIESQIPGEILQRDIQYL